MAPHEADMRAEADVDVDDSDDDYTPRLQPSDGLQERRRRQKLILDKWLSGDGIVAMQKQKSEDQRAEQELDDAELSMQSLLSGQCGKIKNPRQYQLELFERAKTENTIAVLDTGSGKTLIAVLLLKWILDKELEHRAAGGTPKVALFVVASVTLVYQQFAVLEQNLDHKVARISGRSNTGSWNPQQWKNFFKDHDVIVCTADLLKHSLGRSFVTMPQINLLIFDEAHHAKKDHSFAQIIKNFYTVESENSRPRVFGMTASPIDAKSNVDQAARELETLLHCKIATTTDMSFRSVFKRPEERILQFDPLPSKPFDTPLVQSIFARFPENSALDKQFEKCRHIARQLGTWCADEFLVTALSESRLHKYQQVTEARHYTADSDAKERTVAALDAQLSQLRAIVEFIKKEHKQDADIDTRDLSSKVSKLVAHLNETFERPSSHRCIVFVERRPTARLLSEVMQRLGTEYMNCGYLVGGNADEDEDNVSFRQQILTLTKFRKGQINCLFATSVAEEGLDIPDCNLVVRFDMYRTMIQYVQSRGRARRPNSTFIHMLEKHNSIESNLLYEVREQEHEMRGFCMRLPEDRRLLGNEDMLLDSILAKEKNLPTMKIEKTGALLTYANALTYLAEFVSAIPTDEAESMHPTYVVSSRGQQYIAEVVLPGNAPISSAQGQVHTQKAVAKRSAAFHACRELRTKEYLDDHFKPIYQKKLPAMRNALLAKDMDKSNTYIMRTKPSLWASSRGTAPAQLYITIVDFPDKLEKPHQPLVLLTRSPLLAFPKFPIFLNDGRRSFVDAAVFDTPITVDADRVDKFTRFTLAIFRDVFSKVYENDPGSFSYWLAPARPDTLLSLAMLKLDGEVADQPQTHFTEDPDALLDWILLKNVASRDHYKWTPEMPASSLINKFIVDPWDGGRKFYSTRLSQTLAALDPVPEGYMKKKKNNETILDNTISLWRNSRAKVMWCEDQPVLEAERLLFRRNTLARAQAKEVNVMTRSVICPEPLRISAIPPEIAECCFYWPGIIHRLESYLIAREACDIVGVKCNSKMALEAVTKDSDNSGEGENVEKVNFQAGMGDNYERLEFIGDTFLKTATTIATFIQNPNDNEFEFHVKRMLMLCNQNLFNVALGLKLYEYVRSIAFSRRLWYPEGLKLLEGKGAGNEEREAMRHSLAQKTIADVCEALIGAAFITHDRPGQKWRQEHWQNAIHTVTKLVGSEDHTMETMDDYRAAYTLPAYQTGEVSASQRDMAEKVEMKHPYHFRYPRLLRSAFIHPSQPYMVERLPNYQRLEFLGDALLDMASITWLFYRFPTKDPQWLTEHKMAMVSNKFLGAVCVEIGFHKHLRHNSSILQHQVQEYATELLEAKRVAGDARDYWTTVSDPPKCLPDVVESLIGAMFVDSDFDYSVVQDFFDQHIKWYFEDMSIYDSFANSHPCTHMYNALSTTYGCEDYGLMSREIPTAVASEKKDVVSVVIIHDEIIAHSKGKSARYARLRVAQKTLEMVDGLAPADFRRRFGCNCQLLRKKTETEEGSAGIGVDCGI